MRFTCINVRNLLIIFIYLASFSSVSYSKDSYQTELSVSSFKVSDNDPWSSDFESLLLEATIYADEVSVNSHPYEEAGFLEKKSYLSIGLVKMEFGDLPFLTTKENNILVSATYINPESKFIYQGTYGKIDGDVDIPSPTTLTITTEGQILGLGFGKYLTSNSSVLISYLKLDSDTTFFDLAFPPAFTSSKKQEMTGIEYKRVKRLDNNKAYNIEASFFSIDLEDNFMFSNKTSCREIEFIADYYTNSQVSIGGLVSVSSGDVKGKNLGARFSVYITQSLSLFGELSKFMSDEETFGFFTDNDTDEITMGMTARF